MRRISEADIARWDAEDPLAAHRQRFDLPPTTVYLAGNSLGALPKATKARLDAVVADEWGRSLISGWNTAGWVDLPRRVGDRIAPLIGAEPGEVIVADSTSVNLFKLAAAALKLNPSRRRLVTEEGNFPTDLYVLGGLADCLGNGVELDIVPRDEIVDAIDQSTALVVLTHVHYASGAMFDMEALTRTAHEAGAFVLWDLCHSAGVMPLHLDRVGADFAVGCGYKYLNGGPGAPSFLFVAERHLARFENPVAGWFGHRRPFEFAETYEPAPGIERALCGTPAILALVALDEGTKMFADIDLAAVRSKSTKLTEVFAHLVRQECDGWGLTLASPARAEDRGSQICFKHDDANAVMRALAARDVVGDFRAPDIMRFGFSPLYVRFGDVWRAVSELRVILETQAWRKAEYQVVARVT